MLFSYVLVWPHALARIRVFCSGGCGSQENSEVPIGPRFGGGNWFLVTFRVRVQEIVKRWARLFRLEGEIAPGGQGDSIGSVIAEEVIFAFGEAVGFGAIDWHPGFARHSEKGQQ